MTDPAAPDQTPTSPAGLFPAEPVFPPPAQAFAHAAPDFPTAPAAAEVTAPSTAAMAEPATQMSTEPAPVEPTVPAQIAVPMQAEPAAVPAQPVAAAEPTVLPAQLAEPTPVPVPQAEPTIVAAQPVAQATPVAPPRRSGWRTLRKVATRTLTVLVVLAVVAAGAVAGYGYWSYRRALPQHDGSLSLPGLSAPVTVYRDSYGVAQVYARNETDLFMAQGFVHAQDRFWEMDFRRHVTSGRLAELLGKDLVGTDAFLRTLGWRHVAEQEWQLLSPQARGYLTAYAAGVNAWLAQNGGANDNGPKSLEYSVIALINSSYTVEQWDPIDSLAWLKAMAWDLRGNMSEEISRAILLGNGLSRDQIDQLFPRYPYERNRPILADGRVVAGAFDPNPPPPGKPGQVESVILHSAVPSLRELSRQVAGLPHLLGDGSADIGSNSWVISGALTTTGKPILANDPHLSPSMPGIWYQIGLHCDCGFNAEGFSFSGVPGIVIGHNARVAWGFTNLGPDVTDLYLEKIQGDKSFDGTSWTPLTTRQEVIKIAGGESVTITVRSTKHGPLLSDRSGDLAAIAARPPVDASGSPLSSVSPAPTPSLDPASAGVPATATAAPYGIALRWTALDPGRTAEALFGLFQARNFADFRAAAALFEVPAQNMIFADVDGNIGYQSPGRIPIRGKGDGDWPAPGWDPAYDWQGFVPSDQLPYVENPSDEWIVTANQAVVGPQYQHHLTDDWDYGFRSQRIMEMLKQRAASGKISLEDVRQMQFDNRNSMAADLVPALLQASVAPSADRARELLRGWDFQQPADEPAASSAAAAYYNATWRHLLALTFDELPADQAPSGGDRWWEVMHPLLANPNSSWWDNQSTQRKETRDDILSQAMTDAAAELTASQGGDPTAWRWGKMHTLTLTNLSLGKSGVAPIEWLFNRGPKGVSGGGAIVNATSWTADAGYEVDAVPSMRMIVDMSNLDNSRWIQLTGNSGHAFDPNYWDQFELWRTGQNLPMLWSREAVQAAATHTLTLNP